MRPGYLKKNVSNGSNGKEKGEGRKERGESVRREERETSLLLLVSPIHNLVLVSIRVHVIS